MVLPFYSPAIRGIETSALEALLGGRRNGGKGQPVTLGSPSVQVVQAKIRPRKRKT